MLAQAFVQGIAAHPQFPRQVGIFPPAAFKRWVRSMLSSRYSLVGSGGADVQIHKKIIRQMLRPYRLLLGHGQRHLQHAAHLAQIPRPWVLLE